MYLRIARGIFSDAQGACLAQQNTPISLITSITQINTCACTGGPKLRKWYGQGERPTDGGGIRPSSESEPQVDPDAPRDSVLITDADSPTGDAAVLQLILAG